ncbi:TetR family transcriptional regulator [Actinocorallia populi]|uniref:TetR family transcriptional regulator n=1 Tax=Actinocorallia populi TaxID=2079200 RepID=UPI000D08E5A0|nr:TetR family transcriptional regulator [Actinocorallia populi]
MSTTERQSRDKERTRRAILDAAERVFTERGAQASLADIATAAGVTKGGLMHHFPSRDALVRAVYEHGTARMWDEVRAHVDISENRAGKFTRGYVRALTGDSEYLTNAFCPTGLFTVLGLAPQLEEFHRRDAEAWNAAFAADGLPEGRALAVRFAAEGLAFALQSPYLTGEQLAVARAELLALTEPG